MDDVVLENEESSMLRMFIERIERLEEEKAEIVSQIRDVYREGKNAGFDDKVMRTLIRIRKKSPREVNEAETLLELYKRALGMGASNTDGGEDEI
jgi:uncharacterized protein (UPF0335 family)